MSSVIYSSQATRGGEYKVSLLFGALFPLFLAVGLIRRLLPFSVRQDSAQRSVISEARENMSIAMSYALMARAMLQSFARD